MFTLTSQDRHGVVVAGNLPTSFDQTGRVFDIAGLSPTLTTMQGGDKVPKILLREELPFLKIKEATKQATQRQLLETLSIWLIQTQPNVGDVWEREYPIL